MTAPTTPARLWTVKEAATYYQISERTVRNWIKQGELAAERKGRTVRVVPPSEPPCR